MIERLAQPFSGIAPDSARRGQFGLVDVVVVLGLLAALFAIARTGAESIVAFRPPDVLPAVSLDPGNLPDYAARSLLRMFVALIFSVLFTLAYGYAAARSRRAGRILIPVLDVLQSVPVLGFLSVTVTAFIALFPGSLLGLEAACVFAIFTGQAWNMTFAFYHSLKNIPRELDEMAAMYRLSLWERFTRIEVPAAMLPLVWNGMMSFGGAWFYLAAAEAISVLNHSYTLPGIGSYVAAAVLAGNYRALGWSILTMTIVILFTDQIFWRPLVTWADRFKLELTAGSSPRHWLNDLLHATRLPGAAASLLSPMAGRADRLLSRATAFTLALGNPKRQYNETLFTATLWLLTACLGGLVARFVLSAVGLAELGKAFVLGLLTGGRVALLVVLGTVIWTPVGVAIGFRPGLARIAQPLVQLAASFPANFIFPFATAAFLASGISLDWGSILLMALGSQWYIVFNVIAGAQAIPNDLREMAASLRLTGWRKWRMLIGPGIFGAWVTGAITASGGAWNASIVAEIVSWGHNTLTARGLGAYIARATSEGDWPRIVLGVGVMSVLVVSVNRLVWRRLYALAESRYRLG